MAEVERNPFWCPDAAAAERWETQLNAIRKAGSSVGAVIEVVASGVPAGLGEPIYDKLDADLAKAMMSINAVKGVEIGDGFATAALRGEDNADEIRKGNDGPRFLSNHAGGILGGISSGQDVVVRFAVKPTSSILTPRRTIDRAGQRGRDRHQGPPRPLRRHPRGARRRGDDGLRAGRPPAAPPGSLRRALSQRGLRGREGRPSSRPNAVAEAPPWFDQRSPRLVPPSATGMSASAWPRAAVRSSPRRIGSAAV